ncbi:DUF4302 domain-containing protein [Polaribacter porphyrae]|uniref:DUF4302 domain-containing protein n=1 Tax=Polaribacter porphyrae TaxID=1137780 RepID=A0A2S7WMZ2_9FLAO|nr:DUF4302 domain-containing protein [Polaribacter porphyrae]PQJ78985.1 hypothetical protein BTO18_07260 [Polaribacter porphyrae]
MKNHIKNNLLKAWLCIILVSFVFSCQENTPEELFTEPPTKRLNSKEQEVRNLLKASKDGWKVTYFTDSTKLGGYTFLFDFEDDKIVKMASDFKNNLTAKKSEYDIVVGSTIKLSFTTKNVIHDLSDSDLYPDSDFIGQGYKGDFEFLYYGKDGEDLIFRTNRSFIELRFKKASADDWKNLSKHKEIQKAISGETLSFIIKDKTYKFSYNNARRFATNIDKSNAYNFAVGFSATGILIKPSIKVGEKQYHTFKLSNDKRQLVSEDGKFIIYILSPPINMNLLWTIEAKAPNVSPLFLAEFNKVKAANTTRYPTEKLSEKIRIGTARIRGVALPGIYFRSNTATGGYPSQFVVSYQGVPGKADQLHIEKLFGLFNWRFYTHLLPMVDIIAKNAPYKTEPTPIANPRQVKLTSTKNRKIWFIIKR